MGKCEIVDPAACWTGAQSQLGMLQAGLRSDNCEDRAGRTADYCFGRRAEKHGAE